MRNSSADLLEFEELRSLLARYTGSAMGREELRALGPSTDRRELERAHALNHEAIEYLKTAARPQVAARDAAVRLRFTDLPDVREPVAQLRIEGVALEGKQIFDLLALLGRAGEIRSTLLATAERFPLLSAKAASLADLREVLHELSGRILPDGALADHASVALGRIRRSIERQKRAIQESLERFLRAHRADGVLQEEFVTLRNDRFVVPVVAGQQGRVSGVVHGSSGSGQTMFLEPLDTIDLNNELVRLTEEEMRECHRVLREMSGTMRAHSGAIATSLAGLGELDLLFAKAAFALDFDCVIPRFSPEDAPALALDGARHPLLQDVLSRQRKPVVPVSFTLDATRRTLLLSGPNTGGKTVTLKTAGLLALMAQAGIPVPAREAVFPVFDQILADLGDNQSIAESLSSFSSHIRRIREILTLVTPESLVLLDELGRATDPEEGGALGVAIVDCLRGWRAFTIASTHLMALKVYGARQPGVANGSMGFDRDTLQPTYELRVGAPGESAGLAIASRLGMPSDIVAKARAAMSTRDRDLTDFLSQLQEQLEAVKRDRAALAAEREALERKERSLASEWMQRESAKLRDLERRAAEALSQFEAQARQTIEAITQGVEQRKAASDAQRKAARAAREFREQFQSALRPALSPGAEAAVRPLEIHEGSRVRLHHVREIARVKRKLSNDRLEVEAGFLKMQVSLEDVQEVLPDHAPAPAGKLPANVSFHAAGPRWDVSSREVNVIGKRAEEAIEEVDRFLDQAALASVMRVRIVHGHGMGVLKKAIGELLSRHPHVTKFYPATPAEGGTGATIAELGE